MNSNTINRGPLGSAFLVPRETNPVAIPPPHPIHEDPESVQLEPAPAPSPNPSPTATGRGVALSPELVRSLAEVKGQAQFLLYLADQIEDSLHQLVEESDDTQNAFLCRVLGMYSAQLESKHQGLGDRIAETCQEVYVTVREFDNA